MPYDDPDPKDPHELVGHVLPGGPDSLLDMAYVFAEEFARLGFGRERILRIFRNPFYAGACTAQRALGAPAIERIVDECVAVWGGAAVAGGNRTAVASAIARSIRHGTDDDRS